mmetsp:Transcript_154256/g.269858  ORF Transcript_154256/g.269858 Transcript_154256/m.269858 type:complete len:251 (-) Transcript_154256:439-1191(-)
MSPSAQPLRRIHRHAFLAKVTTQDIDEPMWEWLEADRLNQIVRHVNASIALLVLLHLFLVLILLLRHPADVAMVLQERQQVDGFVARVSHPRRPELLVDPQGGRQGQKPGAPAVRVQLLPLHVGVQQEGPFRRMCVVIHPRDQHQLLFCDDAGFVGPEPLGHEGPRLRAGLVEQPAGVGDEEARLARRIRHRPLHEGDLLVRRMTRLCGVLRFAWGGGFHSVQREVAVADGAREALDISPHRLECQHRHA